MKRYRITLALALALMPLAAFAQEASVKVNARGQDIRPIIHDLFQQAKKSYILDPNTSLTLYLSLNDVDFDEAFALICKTAGLEFEIQNGIYFIKPDPKGPSAVKPKTQPATKPAETKSVPANEPIPVIPPIDVKSNQTTGRTSSTIGSGQKAQSLDKAIVEARITTRLQKVDLRVLAAELSKQSGVQIEVDDKVPAYRLDAYLLKTSLKYALDRITKAAGLNYVFTDRNSILIKNGSASKRS